MNQGKRPLVLDRFSNEETKKFRNELINRSLSSLENLSNEIFYEIFDYFDCYQMYQSLTNLNNRFDQFLNSPYLFYRINLHYSQYHSIDLNYKQFYLHHRDQIFSMKLSLQHPNNESFSWFLIDSSSFSRLESLSIQSSQSNILQFLLIYLPRLLSLTINLENNIPSNLPDLYQLIFTLPRLKSCLFKLEKKPNSISLPIAKTNQLSNIQHLTIDHCCTFKELFSILSYTPQLRHLNLSNQISFSSTIENLFPMRLTNLSIQMDDVTFDQFEIFIQTKLQAKLQVLRVSFQSQDTALLNARRWERLITRSLPELKEFSLKYEDKIPTEYSIEANQFHSSFWIERQWIFNIHITNQSIIYVINPYRKRWYDYLVTSTQLTLKNIDLFYLDQFLPRIVRRLSTLTTISHLEIPDDKIPFILLMKFVDSFPEVQTLRIHSLALYEQRIFNANELDLLSSIEESSEISHVYLEEMNEIEEFDSLFNLCPYMEYLHIQSIKRLDWKFILRYIFKKIQIEQNDYLHLLSFRIPTVDEQMIRNVRRMISLEKLVFNSTIQRRADQIILQWK